MTYIPPEYQQDIERYQFIWAQIERICARHLCKLRQVDTLIDLTENTDAVLEANANISIRIRSYKYYQNPETRTQFTIRYYRYYNIPTEFHKILKGQTHYLFYGFYNRTQTRLAGYFILDLSVLRGILPYLEPIKSVVNRDGSSSFLVYSLFQVPKRSIVAMSPGVRKCYNN